MSTRRAFLKTASVSLAGAAVGAQKLGARALGAQRIPLTSRVAHLPANAFIEQPPMTAADIRGWCTAALDAARQAGAQYADIRMAEQVQLTVHGEGSGAFLGATIAPRFMYGVRVEVDGSWAFMHGATASKDSAVALAKHAVMMARGYARANLAPLELAAPVVHTGEWETPMRLDPFSVPLGDQGALITAYITAIGRLRNVANQESRFSWIRETRVFASTAGTMLTQLRRTSEPMLGVSGSLPLPLEGRVSLPGLEPASGGYECVAIPGMQERLKQRGEEAAAMLQLPKRTLDVGRYPIVFDGPALGTVFARTMGNALEMDRVLGYEAGLGRGSYLSPANEMLGTMIANPALTVSADREFPSITAVKWDDDGVEPRNATLIREGRLDNYLATWQAAQPARDGYATSLGCATALDADNIPTVRAPHLRIEPATRRATIEDLCQGVKKGLLIRNQYSVATDPRCISGMLAAFGAVLEITNGKITGRIEGNGVQFHVPRLWQQSMVALGDASTSERFSRYLLKGLPEIRGWTDVSAPAGLFKDLDVISTRVRL
jgi:TldD protein